MGYRSIRGRVGLQPLERSCFNKAFRCVAGVVLANGDRQLLCRRAIRQVEIGHLDPEGVRGSGRVEEVNLVLLVGDRPPQGGRDVWRAGRCNAERDADRAHYRDHLGGRLVGISAIWNGRDVVLVDLGRDRAEQERGTGEAVGRAVGAGQELKAADLLPVGIEGELLVVGRRVGHHLVLLAVMDHEFAVDVFQDRGITGGIGD